MERTNKLKHFDGLSDKCINSGMEVTVYGLFILSLLNCISFDCKFHFLLIMLNSEKKFKAKIKCFIIKIIITLDSTQHF